MSSERGDSLPRVSHHGGAVYVGGEVVAERPGPTYTPSRELVRSLRPRLPDDHWRMVAEMQAAQAGGTPLGPLGGGVSFYLWEADDLAVLVPPDVRQDIAGEAFEAAREVILAGITDHCRRMVPALDAIARFAAQNGSSESSS